MTEAEARATRFCARVVGPFLILLAITIFARYETLPILLPSLMQNAPLVLVTGFWTAMIGLVFFAAHHHFGSPAAIALSILALMLIARGAMLMIFPEAIIAVAAQVTRVPPVMLGATTIAALIGAWLTFVGWVAKY
jgi:hypothetical protein